MTTKITITPGAWRGRPILYLLGDATFVQAPDGLCVSLPPRSGYVLVRDGEAPRVALVHADDLPWRGDYDAAEPWDMPLAGIVRDDDQPGQPSRAMAIAAAGLGQIPRAWSWSGQILRRTLGATVDEAEAELRRWSDRLASATDRPAGRDGLLVRDGIVLDTEVATSRTGLVAALLAPGRLPDDVTSLHQETCAVRCAVSAPMTERDVVRSLLVTAARRTMNPVAKSALMCLAGVAEWEIEESFYWRQVVRAPVVSERERILQARDALRDHYDDRQDIR